MSPKSRSVRPAGTPRSKLVDAAVAVVVVNYRTPDLAKACITALEKERARFRSLKVVLVDGGSGDGSAETLSRWVTELGFAAWVEVLALPVNGGFGWANNQAIQRLMRGGDAPDYVHLLNPDAEIEPGAVERLAEYLAGHPRVAAVGSQLLDTDGRPAGSAFRFPSVQSEFARGARTAVLEKVLRVKAIRIDASEATEVDWVTGASVMFRVDALRQVGLFDEGFFLYHEEVELMWRLRRAGWSIATEPRSRVRHQAGAATGVRDDRIAQRNPAYLYRSRTRFFGLTRGRMAAAGAFAAWLAGYAVWKLRRLLHLASAQTQTEHEFGDHIRYAFPRKHDFQSAVASADADPSDVPAWKQNGWQ